MQRDRDRIEPTSRTTVSRPTAAHGPIRTSSACRTRATASGTRRGREVRDSSPFEPHQRASETPVDVRRVGFGSLAPINVVLADHTVLVPEAKAKRDHRAPRHSAARSSRSSRRARSPVTRRQAASVRRPWRSRVLGAGPRAPTDRDLHAAGSGAGESRGARLRGRRFPRGAPRLLGFPRSDLRDASGVALNDRG